MGHKHISTQKQKMDTMMKKMNIRCGGYQKIGSDLMVKSRALSNKLIEMDNELKIYQELKEKEGKIIPQRMEKWQDMIKIEKERQIELQNEYERLKNGHDALLQ